PKSVLQLGYCNNLVGYGVNDLVSKKLPLFWAGDVYVKKGFALRVQREVFHTRKLFSLAFGGGAGYWSSSITNQKIYTLSAFPVFRFNLLHTRPADLYFDYSVAGPSYISRTTIDQELTGKHFTFQDFMGMGFFAGRNKRMNVEMNINHYSNGNLFTENPGLTIPVTFNLGYAL
ncbi:MAG TPA: acyloxyacyl hydrolase, partial [Flavisolibacter sp.]|nr:acyloxyacyl hydrolase [Flavisolibacter sp.]